MGTTYTDYERRLPYAWAWDPRTRTEYLLHRGYHAIACRPADEPLDAEYRTGTQHPPHTYKGFFYSDRNSPVTDERTMEMCEHILARFLAGYDVRGFIDPHVGCPVGRVNTPPKMDAKYANRARRKKINGFGTYLSCDDVLRQRLEKIEEEAFDRELAAQWAEERW